MKKQAIVDAQQVTEFNRGWSIKKASFAQVCNLRIM